MKGSSKIKIAEVITRLDRGGAPDIVGSIFESVETSFIDIKLISGFTANPSKNIERLIKSQKDVIFISQLRRNVNPINDVIAFFKLYFLFSKERFDIVHTHTAKAGFLGRMAAHLAGVPHIIHQPHGHNFYGYFNTFFSKLAIIFERIFANITDKIFTTTELEKNDFVKYKVCNPDKIVVVGSGIELAKYNFINSDQIKKKKEFNIKTDEKIVGMISRLDPIKGSGYLIEAASEVVAKFPNIKFLVVGDGVLKEKLEQRVKELGIKEKFIFTGWREDVGQILPILDICVLPSLNEAFGRILLEAQAYGIPVVATKVGGIPEVVKDNETGILVPSKDISSLAGAITILLNDDLKRLKMAQAAKAWVGERFNQDKMIKKINNIYKEAQGLIASK